MRKVIVKGPSLSQSGYGEHTRFVLRALRSRPDLFDIYLVNINWGQTGWLWEANEEREWIDFLLNKTIKYSQEGGQFDASLQVTIPNEFAMMAPINIGVTAGIESTKIAPVWVEKSLNMNKIIVTSNHAKYGFDNTAYPARNNETGEDFLAKVSCPVEVVNYPVKIKEEQPINLELEYNFNFLTVGTWIPRKNLENTVRWFVEEFIDREVGLVVKTSLAKNCLQDRMATEQRLKGLLEEYTDRKCKVYLLHGDMSEEEMTSLYRHPKIKSFISFSHGEGFGLPLYEAAYNGLPIVAPAWSGHCDFLYIPVKDKKGKEKKKSMFTSVSYDIRPIQEAAHWDGVLQPDSQWCYPKEWDCKRALRHTLKDIGGKKGIARKLQKWILENMSEKTQYDKMVNAVKEAIPSFDEVAPHVISNDFFEETQEVVEY